MKNSSFLNYYPPPRIEITFFKVFQSSSSILIFVEAKEMDEYLCKNSVFTKPCTFKLNEYSLEWQCGNKNGKIPYANIVAVILKKNGGKFSIKIESDYQGIITASNRFYLQNGHYEDRSRQYNTFVRMLHHHVGNQTTTSFFTGSSMKTWLFTFATSIIFPFALQRVIINLQDALKLWATIGNIFLSLILLILCFRLYPRPYSGNAIPLRFLATITS